MKRVSTGERINLDALRSGLRSLLTQDEASAERTAAQDQDLISELMDVTPSSSFDEMEFRDGYSYDARASFLGHSISTDSTISPQSLRTLDAAGANAAGEQGPPSPVPPDDPQAPIFTKEAVPAAVRRASLLTNTLQRSGTPNQAGDADGAGPSPAHAHQSSVSSLSTVSSLASPTAEGGAGAGAGGETLTARRVLAALIHSLRRGSSADRGKWPANLEQYELRIVDDGEPDMDFPALDLSQRVNTFGEDEFVVLCGNHTLFVKLVRSSPVDVVIEFALNAQDLENNQGARMVITTELASAAERALQAGANERRGSGGLSGFKLPNWVPDSAVSKCQHPGCSTVFGLRWGTNRHRHHCRACGNIFCSGHSSQRMVLPHLGYRGPQRVCDSCYTKYSNATPPASPGLPPSSPLPPSPPGGASPYPGGRVQMPPPIMLPAAQPMVPGEVEVRNLDTGERFSMADSTRIPEVLNPEAVLRPKQ